MNGKLTGHVSVGDEDNDAALASLCDTLLLAPSRGVSQSAELYDVVQPIHCIYYAYCTTLYNLRTRRGVGCELALGARGMRARARRSPRGMRTRRALTGRCHHNGCAEAVQRVAES